MSILYHYTTIDALQKILEDNGKIQFLATRYDYLNDKGELELGIDLLNKCLIEIEEKLNPMSVMSFFDKLREDVNAYFEI